MNQVCFRWGADGRLMAGRYSGAGNLFTASPLQETWLRKKTILKKSSGEFVANLSLGLSSAELRIHKQIDSKTRRAIATFYAVMLSAKNVQ